MNEEDLFAADHEDRYWSRLRRSTRSIDEYSDDTERGGESKGFFSSDYFNSIWEGR